MLTLPIIEDQCGLLTNLHVLQLLRDPVLHYHHSMLNGIIIAQRLLPSRQLFKPEKGDTFSLLFPLRLLDKFLPPYTSSSLSLLGRLVLPRTSPHPPLPHPFRLGLDPSNVPILVGQNSRPAVGNVG